MVVELMALTARIGDEHANAYANTEPTRFDAAPPRMRAFAEWVDSALEFALNSDVR